MAKEMSVKMLYVYLNLLGEEVRPLREKAEKDDVKTLEATKIALATKHNIADKLRRLETLKVMMKEAEQETQQIKEAISDKFAKYVDENSYGYGWDRGLEQLAKKTMVSKTDVLEAKLYDIKKQLKLAGCADDVKSIFANLKSLLS